MSTIWIQLLLLAFIQNISFTMVSRARNRNSKIYHVVCSLFSNGLWFLTLSTLVAADLTLMLAIPYIIGTTTGSLAGAEISMWIEKKLGATT
jgi:hypothetical protein